AGGLAVLPAGAVPASPADVARSPALAELLAALEAKADLVLVDAPPVLGPSDARSLAARVDALVVVARRAAIRNGKAAELHRALTRTPVVKLGFVLTGAGHVGSRSAPRPRSADASLARRLRHARGRRLDRSKRRRRGQRSGVGV